VGFPASRLVIGSVVIWNNGISTIPAVSYRKTLIIRTVVPALLSTVAHVLNVHRPPVIKITPGSPGPVINAPPVKATSALLLDAPVFVSSRGLPRDRKAFAYAGISAVSLLI
jgi:hypothetical protein